MKEKEVKPELKVEKYGLTISQFYFCGNCGKKIALNHKYCWNCGVKIKWEK